SLDGLKEQLGDSVEVFMPKLDARILAGEKVVDGKLPGSWPKNVKTVPDLRLTGGEGIGSLEVVPSPGHTPGHVAFLDTRDRTLYCGDGYTTLGGVATSAKGPLFFPLAAMATWHAPTALESARALRALDPARLAAGHGKVIESPGPRMDAAIARGA